MDDVTGECWLPVVGWEGFYEVSDLGRVRGIDRIDAAGRRWLGRVLKPRPTWDGYLRVSFCRGGRHYDTYIMRLVAEAFLGPCPEGMEVRHGPIGKADNGVSNLSYGTHIENCEDRARDKVHHHKLTRADARDIRARVAAGESQRSVAESYGVNYSTVNRIVKGLRWAVAVSAPGLREVR